MNQDALASLARHVSGVRHWFDNDVVPFLDRGRAMEAALWRKRLIEIEQDIQRRPEIPIALIGSIGAGKSTLLNALLGVEILPVHTTRVCTAALTTIHFDSDAVYKAQIQFFTQEDWENEIAASRVLIDTELSEEERLDLGEWDALKKSTQYKIRAVYGLKDSDTEEPLDWTSLKLPEEVIPYMQLDSPPLAVEENDPKAFKSELRKYLSSEGRYWPLIKSARISGPFPELKNGASLIDLPGVNDPNEAREEVTRQYLQSAPFVWVIFNMRRGMTKDIRNLLIEQKLLRQFLLDGRVNALTFVGTHADEFSIDEAIDELGLPENADVIEVIRARNNQVVKQIRSDLHDIADELAGRADRTEDMVNRLQRTLAQTPIFTVSTKAFMKLRGIGIQRKDYGITDAEDTNCPALINHLETICHDQDLLAHADRLRQKLDFLVDEIIRFFRARRSHLEDQRGVLEGQRKRLREQLEAPRQSLHVELQRVKERAEDSFRLRKATFEERLVAAIRKTLIELDKNISRWTLLHWATLRAIITRNGKFNSPSTGLNHDLNAEIVEPLLDAIPFVWDDFFGNHLEAALKELQGHLEGRSDVFLARLKSEAQAAGTFDKETLDAILGDVETSNRNLRFYVEETIKGIRRTINRVRSELATSIGDTIQQGMLPAYERAKLESGAGMKKRMLDIVQSHAKRNAQAMFANIEEDLLEGVSELYVQFTDQLKFLNDCVCQQADRVLKNLGGGHVEKEAGDVEQVLTGVCSIQSSGETFLLKNPARA